MSMNAACARPLSNALNSQNLRSFDSLCLTARHPSSPRSQMPCIQRQGNHTAVATRRGCVPHDRSNSAGREKLQDVAHRSSRPSSRAGPKTKRGVNTSPRPGSGRDIALAARLLRSAERPGRGIPSGEMDKANRRLRLSSPVRRPARTNPAGWKVESANGYQRQEPERLAQGEIRIGSSRPRGNAMR